MNPIPSAIQDVLDLFQNQLAPVTFGGLEAGVLTSGAEAVREAASALVEAEAAAEEARSLLVEKQDELAQKAQRALAYARIYAEDDPTLLAKVEAIALPRTGRRTPKEDESGQTGASPMRRRGRPPKNDVNGSLLAPRPPEALRPIELTRDVTADLRVTTA
jgi:ElaB/YqjD/DUF883 family membrane-anchored ribosome-binding protein